MNTTQHYGGSVELVFNPDKHTYTASTVENGEKVERIADGVTSALGIIAKPALVPWAAKLTADTAKSLMLAHAKDGKPFDEVSIETIAEQSKKAVREKKDTAAQIGHLVHAWIEGFIKGENPDMPMNEQAANGCKAFMEWVSVNHVEFIASEKRVYSKTYNFAGTLDFIAVVNGKRVLGDIKTSAGIYDEYFIQLGGYDLALEEEHQDSFDEYLIVNCKKEPDKAGNILEVRGMEDRTKRMTARNAFLSALHLSRNISFLKNN